MLLHHASRLIIPENIGLVFPSPCSPKLNPAEKPWWTVKRTLKNKFFANMDELTDEISVAVKQLSNQSVLQLTAYQYLTHSFWTIFND